MRQNQLHASGLWLGKYASGLCDFMGFASIIGDSLYYVITDSENFLRKKICRADPDGTNRKALKVMDDVGFLQPGSAFCQNGYLIYSYFTDTAQDGSP